MSSTKLTLYGAVIAACAVVAASCTPGGGGTTTDTCDPTVLTANLDCKDPTVVTALGILRAMSLEEKVQQLSGPPYNPNNFFDQETNERLGVPGLLYMDGPRGVRWYNSDYGTTVFPVASARASSWDLELERLIGKVMAKEMRSMGRHVLLAPTINQVTHPRWGRAQESYGEDTFLLGTMGASFIEGAQYDPTLSDPADPDDAVEQTYRIQACVKHFAANNIEDTRIYVNAVLDERTLHEVYLPHFKRAVDAGAACVMASYNRVNGSYSGYSKELLRDVLKTDWKYTGYVISDWFAKGNTISSPAAGLDIEMPFSSGPFPSQFDSNYFYGQKLTEAVNTGLVDPKLVDESALRVLHKKVEFGLTTHEPGWTPWLTKADAAQELALRAAREGTVLLKNGTAATLDDDVLPLSRDAVSKIAVIGKFANSENMGDKGSSDARVVDGTLVITPAEGLRELHPDADVESYENVAGNEAAIQSADVAVVIGAYFYADLARSSSGEEGEWKDRESLSLPARDLANIEDAVALKQQNPNLKVIVVMKSGGAVVVKDWESGADAILMAWFGGMKEGIALAELLFGDVNPSGKTCQSFPVNESDLSVFDNVSQDDVTYDYYHGYRWLEKQGIAPQYHFGHGLSYTTFTYSNLVISNPTLSDTEALSVTVDVTNTGPVAGSEVVQAYVGFDSTAITTGWGRPVKQLAAFARVEGLAPGAKQTVTLTIATSDLAYWDSTAKKLVVEKKAHKLYVGPSADVANPNMLTSTFTIQ